MAYALDALWQQVSRLYKEQRFSEALEFANKALQTEPASQIPRITFWQACLLCLVNQPNQALAALREGLDRGLWWNPSQLVSDSDLASLQERPEFKVILEKCQQRKQVAQGTATAKLQVFPPPEPSPHNPLLIAFHMKGSNLELTAPHWLPVVGYGILLAVPQSSQVEGPDGFCWDDAALAEQEVQNALVQLQAQQTFDPQKIVLAGASQGAALAARLTIQGVLPSRGFIAVVGAGALEPLLPYLEPAIQRGVKGVFITGEHDYMKAHIEMVHKELASRGPNVGFEVVPGLGHDYPNDMPQRLGQALEFILGL